MFLRGILPVLLIASSSALATEPIDREALVGRHQVTKASYDRTGALQEIGRAHV